MSRQRQRILIVGWVLLSLIAVIIVVEREILLGIFKGRTLPKDWTQGMEYRAQYQEIRRAEILKWVDFKPSMPTYWPKEMEPYKVAIRTSPEPKAVVFFWPLIPQQRGDRTPALMVEEEPAPRLDISKTVENFPPTLTINTIKLSTGKAIIYKHEPGWGLFFQKEGKAISINWYGEDANKSELIKIAEGLK